MLLPFDAGPPAMAAFVANPDGNTNGMPDAWETEIFGSALIGQNLASDDADGDSLSNLLEYALNTHPMEANSSPLTHDMVTVDQEKHLRLTVPKNALATGLLYTVEVSSDMGATWGSDQLTDVEAMIDTPELFVVRDRTPMNAANRRFIRLHVSSSAP